MNWRMNNTFLALIPKMRKALELETRFGRLVNRSYKVLAKILANRLKDGLGCIVDQTQGALIEGREIMDEVLVANEIINGREGFI